MITRGIAAGFPNIQGRCPSCGQRSLFVGKGGFVTCSVLGCSDPGAATDLLERQPGPDVDTVKGNDQPLTHDEWLTTRWYPALAEVRGMVGR